MEKENCTFLCEMTFVNLSRTDLIEKRLDSCHAWGLLKRMIHLLVYRRQFSQLLTIFYYNSTLHNLPSDYFFLFCFFYFT